MTLTPTISLLEAFVVGVGAMGILICFLMLGLLWRDRMTLIRNKQNGVDKRLVMGNVRSVLLVFAVVAIFVALGLYAMTLPEPARPANRRGGELVNWGLISIEVLATATILWDYIDRRKNMRDLARRIVDRRRRHDDPPPEPAEAEAEVQERRARQQERIGEADYQGHGSGSGSGGE